MLSVDSRRDPGMERITDHLPPQDAMSRQVQAEREKYAASFVIRPAEIAGKFVEAFEVLRQSPAALQLRAMNIIKRDAEEARGTHYPDPNFYRSIA
jgi:hypothetical protein